MSTIRNGTASDFDTDPASGYNMRLSCLFLMFFLFLYRLSMNMNNPYEVIILFILYNIMIYFIAFGIKIYCKITKNLTVRSTMA
jgi:Ca2+/Na+ antiporter